jgi:hypothetical protein
VSRLALLAVIALSGCASTSAYEAPVTRVSAASADIAASADCTTGNQACIEAVVGEMERRYERLASACDHRAAFALMYLRVTDGVKQPDTGRFDDERYLHRLDALFARLYFKAFDSHQAGKPTDPAWRIAFESAQRGLTTGIGDMLLGMNAHISNDLPFAVVAAGFSKRSQADFNAVNNLLGHVQDPMIREEARMLDPEVATASLPYLGVHGGEVANVIAGWRTEAWQNARKLADAPTAAARAQVGARIRAAAAERATVIQALGSNRLLGGDPATRDSFCATRGAGAQLG